MYNNLSQQDHSSPEKTSRNDPDSYQDHSHTTDKDIDLLVAGEFESELHRERVEEIKHLDQILDGSSKVYKYVLTGSMFLAVLNILLRLYIIHTLVGLILMTFEFFQVYILLQCWKLSNNKEIKIQRYILKVLKFILIGSILTFLISFFTFLAHNNDPEYNPTSLMVDPNSKEHKNYEKNLLLFQLETVALIISLLNGVITFFIFRHGRKAEAILYRKYILKRDMGMPRLLNWD